MMLPKSLQTKDVKKIWPNIKKNSRCRCRRWCKSQLAAATCLDGEPCVRVRISRHKYKHKQIQKTERQIQTETHTQIQKTKRQTQTQTHLQVDGPQTSWWWSPFLLFLRAVARLSEIKVPNIRSLLRLNIQPSENLHTNFKVFRQNVASL